MLSNDLAERILAIGADTLTDAAHHWAKIALKDLVGVTLAGAREETAAIPRRLYPLSPDGGPAPVLGTAFKTSPLDASFLNGVSAHALDFDDGNDAMGGHPSAPIIPALLALASTQRLSGRDFMLAYAAGFELETRMGLGLHFHHYEKGWHPTATLGVFGATAACAKALGLDAEKTATALSISASLASGVKANFGSMTKPLHVGHSTRNGLIAALLAQEGFTANLSVFEHKQGFLNVYNGPGTFDVERILANWGAPLMLVEQGLGIKRYPCCAGTHSAIDAMLDLMDAYEIDANRIVGIQTEIHPRRLVHIDRPRIRGALDAKFSLQYCLARAAKDGRISLEHFEEPSYNDSDVLGFMELVHASPTAPSAPLYGATVRINMNDGSVFENHVERARGRGRLSPLNMTEIDAKFIDCAARSLSHEDCRHLVSQIDELENCEDVHAIFRDIRYSAQTDEA